MDLFKSIKRVANNIAAKNKRRRDRVKGTKRKNGLFVGEMNTAQRMVLAWIAPPKTRGGLGVSDANLRAAKRHQARKAQWKDTPVSTNMSRQVRRRLSILATKAARTVNVSGVNLAFCVGRGRRA